MTTKLFVGAITKFLLGVILVGLLIFLPAGSLSFTYGWLLMAILFVPMFLAGLGKMYVADERFKNNIDKHAKGTAEFISEAIKIYCTK